MLLSDAIEGYLLFKATRCAPTTIETDRIHLRQLCEFLGNSQVDEVTPEDIRRFLAHERARDLSPHTIKRQYATYSSLYTWLTSPEMELAETNPTDAVPMPRTPQVQPKALNTDEVRALVEATSRSRMHRRDRSLVMFMLDTGARATEVCGVRMPHVDLETGRVLLTETKGGDERHVFIRRVALKALWAYIHTERGEPLGQDDHLYLTFDHRPLNRHTLRNIIYRLADAAGIKHPCSPHTLRHTSAILYLRSGAVSLIVLQHMLGHKDISTTRQYLTALNDDDVREATRKGSPCDNLRL